MSRESKLKLAHDQDRNETLRFLIEQKISSMNTAGNICMTWWVSSVLFCGSVLAAVWLQKAELVKSGSLLLVGLSLVLTAFFAGIVLFGIVAIKYLKKFEGDICRLTNQLHHHGIFRTETAYFIRAMKIGAWSFALILIAWVGLCITLWIEFSRTR